MRNSYMIQSFKKVTSSTHGSIKVTIPWLHRMHDDVSFSLSTSMHSLKTGNSKTLQLTKTVIITSSR